MLVSMETFGRSRAVTKTARTPTASGLCSGGRLKPLPQWRRAGAFRRGSNWVQGSALLDDSEHENADDDDADEEVLLFGELLLLLLHLFFNALFVGRYLADDPP